MAAYSFALDLLQLTHGEFMSRYKWHNLSESEFLRLRAAVAEGGPGTILGGGTAAADGFEGSIYTGKVVTGFYFRLVGSQGGFNISITSAGSDVVGSYSLSNMTGTTLPAEVNLTNILLPAPVFTTSVDDGTPSLSYLILGYTPPSL